MPKGTPMTAGSVKAGWVLHYDGEDREVVDVKVHPLMRGQTERQVTIRFAGGAQARGDEFQTVYVVREGQPG